MSGVEASQRFPFINLEKAISRAKELYDADQRGNETSAAGAFEVWQYSEKSSGGHQTIAALKMYGLLAGESGKVKLSKQALDYFRDEREDHRAKHLQEFATSPPMLRSLWNSWGSHPPGDALARSHLKIDRQLSEQSARAVLGIYKDNLAFANLKGDGKLPERQAGTGPGNEDKPPVKVGDYIQWTSGGSEQFKQPRKVTWIADDGSHVQAHGSATGIPVAEVTIVDPPKPTVPSGFKAQPASNLTGVEAAPAKGGNTSPDISVLLVGNRLQITADVDAQDLVKFKQVLDQYEQILKLLS